MSLKAELPLVTQLIAFVEEVIAHYIPEMKG